MFGLERMPEYLRWQITEVSQYYGNALMCVRVECVLNTKHLLGPNYGTYKQNANMLSAV